MSVTDGAHAYFHPPAPFGGEIAGSGSRKIVRPLSFTSAAGDAIAYRRIDGTAEPGVLWLGGMRSSMDGAKATALEAWARARGRACLRFDWSGHGLSGGAFAAGTVGRWLTEARQALETLTAGPQIVVGSSLGGWIALLLAEAAPARVAGLVLIAPAADMTERLIWAGARPGARAALARGGV